MSNIKTFEKPVGFHDLLPDTTAKKRIIENQLQALFDRWGYREMMTPTLEYEETVGKVSKITSEKLFKLLDRMGQTLVLRPDMTAPIARVVSSILKNQNWPIRLSYHSNVFRAQAIEGGRAAEFFQSGIELVGEGTPDADVEVLALAVEALKLLKVGDFSLIVGHTGYLDGILEDIIEDGSFRDKLKTFLADKNFVGYREEVLALTQSDEEKNILLSVLKMQGDITELETALTRTKSERAKKVLTDLIEVWNLLKIYQAEEYITFDLTMVPHLEYYTGLVFEGTVANLGFPICGGGRYDSLLDAFDNPQQAIGFALKINRILDIAAIMSDEKDIIKVIYDNKHQKEALGYAADLRKESNAIVETYQIEGKDKSSIAFDENAEIVWLIEEETEK